MENPEEQVPLLPAPNGSNIPDSDASVEEHSELLIREDEMPREDLDLTKDIVQKIDLRVLPLLFITFNFNFIDKTILSSASVFGLKKDTSLTGDQYAWVSSIFYFGYFIWEYPTTILIQKLPVGKYVAINIMAWGMVVTATSECTNYHQLLVARFFTGALEATISPAFLYITSMWYTRDEIPSRMGVWYAGNSFGGAVAGVLSYVIGHIEHPLSPWRWLYIVFGLATILWGVIVFYTLPDSIETAEFLDEKERQCAGDRVVFAGTGINLLIENQWKPEQVVECLLDAKTWFFFSISLLTQTPNGGTQAFTNLILTGFGFSNFESTLVGLPASCISFSTILVTGWLATTKRDISTILIAIMAMPPIIGSALMTRTGNQGAKLVGYYLLGFSHGIIPLTMSLIGSNVKGVTKKMTMTALMFIAFCAGNLAGPQFFNDSEAPHYPTAFKLIALSYGLAFASSVGLRIYLVWANGRRIKAESVDAVSVTSHTAARVSDMVQTDLTDYHSPGFRYRL